ncbi:unnamed protein product [Lasius platythorax]|uniref:Uncharacterized protein n=1 Tax=Lasius platythorax TaxID=488582 RepID=A0AAV2NL78_9HYME
MMLAYQDPILLAYALKGTPGYSARIRGEAAQLYRCTSVPVLLRATEDCFQELPITINGHPAYLQPRTRIITFKGTRIACDPATAAMYRLNNVWYTFLEEAERAVDLPTLFDIKTLPWGRLQVIPADDSVEKGEKVIKRPRDNAKDYKEPESPKYTVESILIQLPASVLAGKLKEELSIMEKYFNIFWITVIQITLVIILGTLALSILLANMKKSTSEILTLSAERDPYALSNYKEENDSSDGSTRSVSRLEELLREPHSITIEETLPTNDGSTIPSQIHELCMSYQRLERRLDRIAVRR